VVARTKVARTRFTPAEHAQLEADARSEGITVGEYMRKLYLERRDLPARVDRIEARLLHVETELSDRWLQEGQHDSEVS
jgi:Mobilization protein NikA